MYESFIKEYVKKISNDDIINFANKNNINLSNEEADTIKFYLKNEWETLYKGNPTKIFKEIKVKINDNAYQKILELYNEFKNKFF